MGFNMSANGINNKNKIFSNLLTKVYDENIIRTMIVSLSRKGAVTTKREMININKFDKRNNTVSKKLDNCIMINLDDAIDYLEKQLESGKGIFFFETRQNWLNILRFTKANINKLYTLHNDPNNGRSILDELLSEKDKF